MINLKEIDIKVARRLKEQKALKIRAMPFKEDNEKVYVLLDKDNKEVCDEIRFIFRKNIKRIMVNEQELNYLLKAVYLGQKEEVLNIVIDAAIQSRASDIHFEPYKDFVLIRFRIDGLLRIMYILNKSEYEIISSKIKINSDLDITEKRKSQDGKMVFNKSSITYDLRVSILPILYGEKIVIRILYGDMFKYSLENLRLTEQQLSKLKYIMKVKTGLIIVNGPTGSGKSTTLYCILQDINKESINISSLEDPVEAVIPGINQMSLNRAINMTFADGLRSILRQDPDVVMVGEIRDEETAEIAIRSALTGHKVYSTIHTGDPEEVYFRLEDMGIKNYLIRDSLVGIISQRLIRVLCNKCKKYVGERNILRGERVKTYEKLGCSECNYSGYRGRALVASINVIDKKVKNDIKNSYRNNKMLNNLEMLQNLKALLLNGEISFEDYLEFIEVEGIEEFDEE